MSSVSVSVSAQVPCSTWVRVLEESVLNNYRVSTMYWGVIFWGGVAISVLMRLCVFLCVFTLLFV